MHDKPKIPGTPEAATSHQRLALSRSNIDLESSDHNYHSVNLTRSVILNCQIPNSPITLLFALIKSLSVLKISV